MTETTLRTKTVEFPKARRDRRITTGPQCWFCRRPLRGDSRMVHLVHGGAILHPEDEAAYVPDNGDVGFHEVGGDCAKRIGIEWTWPPANAKK